MEQDKVQAIVSKKISESVRLCRRVGEDFDPETIHEFRVSVKDLRSFFRMLRMAGSETKAFKIPVSYIRLYHIAGPIRDALKERELLLSLNVDFPHYLSKLDQRVVRQRTEWKKYDLKKTRAKIKERPDRLLFEDLNTRLLADFVQCRLKSVDDLCAAVLITDDQVHSMRKHMKDILYNVKTAKATWRQAYKTSPVISVKELNKLTDTIGDYNDRRLLLKRLSAYAVHGHQDAEKEDIRRFCDGMADELRQHKKVVIKATRDYLTVLPKINDRGATTDAL